MRIALTNAWNDALGGGKPIRPFHFGSVSSKIGPGSSSSGTRSVL